MVSEIIFTLRNHGMASEGINESWLSTIMRVAATIWPLASFRGQAQLLRLSLATLTAIRIGSRTIRKTAILPTLFSYSLRSELFLEKDKFDTTRLTFQA